MQKLKLMVVLLVSIMALNVQADNLIKVEHSVIIHRSQNIVFDFAANLLNDPLWREEVNTMTSDDEFGLGAVYLEDSHLGIRPHFLTQVEITSLNAPKLVEATTTSSNPYYLKVTRHFERFGLFSTLFTYELEFDRAMAQATMGGFTLPDKLVRDYYTARIAQYQGVLKFLLESGVVE
ncbi:hypothetical protein R50073_13480 [Maricurvus nonylphenolicus]|uniref:hypothetical protein n=1 Tax=Maricurvus nonylphenolicus TaxID=1008307 RepID=UPI0036F371D7